ncbi:MAG: hypothetical protein GY820_30980 [Gammaproteobacteria bacterium]|nr:hypothetical protein [Gammaproteobacteria bacterium]
MTTVKRTTISSLKMSSSKKVVSLKQNTDLDITLTKRMKKWIAETVVLIQTKLHWVLNNKDREIREREDSLAPKESKLARRRTRAVLIQSKPTP